MNHFKKLGIFLFSLIFIFSFILFASGSRPSLQEKHPKIELKGYEGSLLSIESKLPYSPKRTCGACHDYDRITQGYHFQQGRSEGGGKISISDTYDPKYPWNLSSGMYGKLQMAYMDPGQLAKKINAHPSEIDESSFYFVQTCSPCHPGGGWAEYDRRGNLYYNEDNKKFGYELSNDDPKLDGDYTSLNKGNERYGSPWHLSGTSEADCLICHLHGYQWKEREAALKRGFFKYAPSVGAGWGVIKFLDVDSHIEKAISVEIDYTKKDVADFENLHLQIKRRPSDENCWACHGHYGEKKRGYDWTLQMDVHKVKGMDCLTCHPGDWGHNLAKGDSLQQTVREDLDQTMNSCEDCHYRRKDKRAPRFRHPFSPRHMKRISCQTCHIPYRTIPVELVYDHTTGETQIYQTSKFLSRNPIDPKLVFTEERQEIWYPSLKDYKGKIIPVKSALAIYWGDLDEKTNIVKPIHLWKIRELKKPLLKDDNGDGIPEVNTPEEIKSFLIALKGKDRFGNPIATIPVLIKGGFLYRLDKKGVIEKIPHEQAQPIDFSINHNIRPGFLSLGFKGCGDCHIRNSPFFLRKILIDPYDEKGKPLYIEAWERLGIDRERLSRLLLEQ
ncbi:MAG: hypothetical protein ACUVTN_07825 [Thermodesulfobacteriota bacterium]